MKNPDASLSLLGIILALMVLAVLKGGPGGLAAIMFLAAVATGVPLLVSSFRREVRQSL